MIFLITIFLKIIELIIKKNTMINEESDIDP